MERYVVEDEYVAFIGRYVRPGQRVYPGMALFEIMPPSGVAIIVKADNFGEVGHIEGVKIKSKTFDDIAEMPERDLRADGNSEWIRFGMGSVYARGNLLCQVLDRQGNKNAQTTGLKPTKSTRVSRHRAEGINLN